MGRPTKIDQTVRTRRNPDTGEVTKITAADAIIEALRIGDYVESAAAAAGVDKQSVYHWMRTGADITARIERAHERGEKPPRPTPFERKCQTFSHAVGEATEQWHLAALGILEQASRGGRKVTTVTEKVVTSTTVAGPDGLPRNPIVERTTKTEELAPNVSVLMWRLTRRFPDRYNTKVELTGADGQPLDISITDRAKRLGDQLDTYLQGIADAGATTPTRPAQTDRG